MRKGAKSLVIVCKWMNVEREREGKCEMWGFLVDGWQHLFFTECAVKESQGEIIYLEILEFYKG